MAIHTEDKFEGNRGLMKEIDEDAKSMIYDNLQKDQYQYPIKSTIREISSNAKDGVNEKFAAIEILEGRKQESDFYLRRDDPMFKNSNFHPEYYDLNWLERRNIPVEIIHRYGDMNETRDLLIIRDYGVGLGTIPHPDTGVSRLEGYFKLGYSSKRNTSLALGKFGIGAKSALSLGVDFYTIINRYNGEEFIFNVYSYKVDPVIPKFDMATGQTHKRYIWNEGTEREFVFYSRPTTEKNGIEFQVYTKKIHRSQYVDAVKSQLLYFTDVIFKIEDGNSTTDVDFISPILHEDENLIITDNNQFSKPHLVIGRVNYGYIDFAELELEDMRGNVGFKVKAEDVDINPSRESVKWLGRTKEAVLRSIEEAAKTASALVSEKLNETDFFLWLKAASSLLANSNSNAVLHKMGTLIDRSRLKPVFKPYPKIKFSERLLEGIEVTRVYKTYEYDKATNKNRLKPSRENGSIHDLLRYPIYIQTENTSNLKETWLLQSIHPDGFVKVYFQKGDENEKARELFLKNSISPTWNATRTKVYDLLLETANVKYYEDIEVPDKVIGELNDSEAAYAIAMLPAAERRKLEERIVVSDLTSGWHNKIEPTIKEVMEIEDVVVYGFKEDRQLLIDMARSISLRDSKILFYNISRDNAKHFIRHTHIHDFIRYYDHSTKTIGMHNKLVQIQTARKINEVMEKLRFLEFFSRFNSEMADLYSDVTSYRNIHYSSRAAGMEELSEYSNKVIELQLFIEDHKDDAEAIAVKSKEIFDTEFAGAVGIDLPIYRKLEVLLEYVEPIHLIMNRLSLDIGISYELEREVREILQTKGVKMT